MLERFSVRKPFTVLVGVILVIILGVVAFQNTTTDLMPNMNLPYALIMTTNIGSTPEEIETQITQPIEGRLATVSGIDNISSVSREHMSMVILEFVSSVNMDSASLEIRESLDMLTLPDSAGKPVIMKLNPNMLPVMVAAIDVNNMELDEISKLVEEDIAPSLEGVTGVASASLSGLLENQLHVVIYQEKIDAANKKIQDAVQKMIDDAKKEMEAAIAAEVQKQVTAYSESRIPELMATGLTAEQAQAQLAQELPAVTEQIAAAIAEEMAAQAGENGAETPDTDSIGIPAEMLTVDTVKGILQAQNFSMPAGSFTENDTEYMVRTGDKFTKADEIKNLLIADLDIEGLEPFRLSDVADIFTTDNSGDIYTRVNGNPAVMVTMQKQNEFATSDVTHDLLAKMEELEETHEGLHVSVLMDQGQYIDVIVDSVLQNLIIGGLLAILILLIFLRDFRPTLVVGISIPLSIMLAFTAMYFSGVTLNIISMSGLALGVGMLVDNSIVVIENIYRMRNEGVPARKAAIKGARQVSGAIAASTLTTIAVFLPILFIQGLTRQIFADLGLTIAYSLLASLLIALTVVPAACSTTFRSMKEKEHKHFNRFLDRYAVLLRGAMRFKWLVLLVAAGLLGFSIWGALRQGTQFIPSMDSSQISASVTMPEGTLFEETTAMADTIQERLSDIEDIETVGVTVGGNMMGAIFGMSGGGSSGTNIDIYLILKEKRSMTNDELSQEIRDRTEDLDCDISVEGSGADMTAMMGSSISLQIEGRDLDLLRDTAKEVADIVRTVPGATEVSDGSERLSPELRIHVNKNEAMKYNLTVAQVLQAVAAVLTEPEGTMEMTLDSKDYEVIVSDGDWTEPKRKEIENLELKTPGGETVKLSEIAEITEDTGLSTINRQNGNRVVTVSGEIEAGYNVGLVNDEIKKALESYDLPEGIRLVEGGQSQMITEAFDDLWLMAILAIMFIYLIMVAQFQSLLSPFIVMFTIPLAFTGGFLALMITGMPLSVVGMVGLILLAGVVVNNGIVLVDYINQLRKDGVDKAEAIVEACKTRLRPVLMTALTTIVAMSTMSIGMGTGSEMAQPMAVTTIGGLIYATVMTLFVVPIMYDMFHRKNKKLINRENLDGEEPAGYEISE